MARLRLILAFIAVLTVAAAASLGLGLGVSWLIGRMHCEGEQLSCNIDDAIGAYGTLIWAGASVIVFGISMLFRNKRIALIVAALVRRKKAGMGTRMAWKSQCNWIQYASSPPPPM